MEKKQTALQISIARKKDRLKECHDKLKNYDPNNSCSSEDDMVYERIFLFNEILQDEKLLEIEKKEIEYAYNKGIDAVYSMTIKSGKIILREVSKISSQYYSQTYQTDGKQDSSTDIAK